MVVGLVVEVEGKNSHRHFLPCTVEEGVEVIVGVVVELVVVVVVVVVDLVEAEI